MADQPEDPSPLTPTFDLGRDGGVAAVRAVIGAVPAVGPIVDSTLFRIYDIAGRKRDVEFFQALTHRVRSLEEHGKSIEEIFEDPAFLAATRRVLRAAQEEGSDEKRALLLNALMNSGTWGTLHQITRTRFLDLIIRFNELHVFLLRFYIDPRSWLQENAKGWSDGGPFGMSAGTNGQVLRDWVFKGNPLYPTEVHRAVAELNDEGLIDLSGLNTVSSSSSLYSQHTTERGKEFLDFIADPQ